MRVVAVHEGCGSTWHEGHRTGALNALTGQQVGLAGGQLDEVCTACCIHADSMKAALLCCMPAGHAMIPPTEPATSTLYPTPPHPDARPDYPDTCLCHAVLCRWTRWRSAARATWQACCSCWSASACPSASAAGWPPRSCRCTCSWSTTAGEGCEGWAALHAGRAGKVAARLRC
jgi:hypothetical protein